MYHSCSPGKRSATGEQALLAQIQLINGEADIIGGHRRIGYCAFSLINAAALSPGEVSKRISNGVLLWIGARRQLLSAAGWIAPSFFDCAPIHAASTERFSSGEAKAIWLSPVPANLPP